MKNKTSSSHGNLSKKIAGTLISYVKTQFVLIAVVTAGSWILLSLLGVRFALLLALVTGSLSIIPVLGITTAAVIAAIVAVLDGLRFLPNLPEIVEGLAVLVVYGLFNISIDYFLSPYVTGKITKIHPLLLLLAVILGTSAFGVLGAIFAVPVVLVAKTMIEHNKNINIQSKVRKNL